MRSQLVEWERQWLLRGMKEAIAVECSQKAIAIGEMIRAIAHWSSKTVGTDSVPLTQRQLSGPLMIRIHGTKIGSWTLSIIQKTSPAERSQQLLAPTSTAPTSSILASMEIPTGVTFRIWRLYKKYLNHSDVSLHRDNCKQTGKKRSPYLRLTWVFINQQTPKSHLIEPSPQPSLHPIIWILWLKGARICIGTKSAEQVCHASAPCVDGKVGPWIKRGEIEHFNRGKFQSACHDLSALLIIYDQWGAKRKADETFHQNGVETHRKNRYPGLWPADGIAPYLSFGNRDEGQSKLDLNVRKKVWNNSCSLVDLHFWLCPKR